MTGNERVRLIVFVALLAVLLFNFPFLSVLDAQTIHGIPLTAPILFGVWLLLIAACALAVIKRRR